VVLAGLGPVDLAKAAGQLDPMEGWHYLLRRLEAARRNAGLVGGGSSSGPRAHAGDAASGDTAAEPAAGAAADVIAAALGLPGTAAAAPDTAAGVRPPEPSTKVAQLQQHERRSFSAAVHALADSGRTGLVKQALLALIASKPAFTAGMDADNVDHLLRMRTEHALLAVCQARCALQLQAVNSPARLFTANAKKIEQGFRVHEAWGLHAKPEVWRRVAGLVPEGPVPAFVEVWFAVDVAMQGWLKVGGATCCCLEGHVP
jgi:hypothetical protein